MASEALIVLGFRGHPFHDPFHGHYAWGSVLVEEVLVYALDHVRLLILDADVVADHQPA
jgi:hypothetical protein